MGIRLSAIDRPLNDYRINTNHVSYCARLHHADSASASLVDVMRARVRLHATTPLSVCVHIIFLFEEYDNNYSDVVSCCSRRTLSAVSRYMMHCKCGLTVHDRTIGKTCSLQTS